MRDPERNDTRRRRVPFSLKKQPVRRRGEVRDPLRFEVQKRDEGGLIASVVFSTERQALNFADSLSRLMARNGEPGWVHVVWPYPTT